MPRPKKCRRVCDYPQTLTFLPEDHKNREQAVILTVDEYETIRLIDKEGLSQEQCGDFMQVARTTVQQIYAGARKKLADVLVDGEFKEALKSPSLQFKGSSNQRIIEVQPSLKEGHIVLWEPKEYVHVEVREN